jgi:hypothetical protein
MATAKKNEHSSFWLTREDIDLTKMTKHEYLVYLSKCRKAIANFVNILTGKAYPVRYNNNTDKSFTNGEMVVIGTDMSRGEFDATCGVALHESAHIVKSDFELKRLIWGKMPQSVVSKSKKAGVEHARMAKFAGTMLNWVEDRYIDAWVYNEAPGYRGYYDALYNKYWHSDQVALGLVSKAYRMPILPSYEFRVINLTNPATDLTAIPGLKDIVEAVDLECILRLERPQDRLAVTFQVLEIIADNLMPLDEARKKFNNDKKKNKGKPSPQENEEGGNDSSPSDDEGTDDSDETENGPGEGEEDDSTEEKSEGGEKLPHENAEPEEEDLLGGEESELAENDDVSGDEDEEKVERDINESTDPDEEGMADAIRRLVSKQEDFLEGNFQKNKLTPEEAEILKSIEDSQTDIVEVGSDFVDDGEAGIVVPSVECVLIKNLTAELLESNTTPFRSALARLNESNDAAITRGVSLGQALSRRLKIRGETKVLKTTRRDKGKIDGRLINELGFGNDKVFHVFQEDKYDNLHLHISVDCSGSMSFESKWSETLTSVVAICKAAAMIPNIDVVVSLRTGSTLPYVAIAYDSRRDKFSKLVRVLSKVFPAGSTPEGLTYQVISKLLPLVTPDRRVFFLNFSDGIPEFYTETCAYSGDVALLHTAKQVKKMVHAGVEIMSYFINTPMNGVNPDHFKESFTKMYGKAGIMVNPVDMVGIAKEMNQRFLAK